MKGPLFATIALVALTACARQKPPEEPGLIVDSHVEFYEADGKTVRAAPKAPRVHAARASATARPSGT